MKNRLRKKLGKQQPFTIATNSIKYLGVTLTEQIKALYDKNFKSLKKSKKTSEDEKVSYAHGLVELT